MILSTYLYTYLLTSLLSCSQTDNLPCIHMHTCVMIPVIWSGTILLVAFITTTSYCYDQRGYTAMIKAAHNGHKDVVEYLVSQGADKDIKTDVSTTLVHEHLYKMIYLYICMYRYRYAPIVLFEWINICIYVCMYVCEYLSLLAFISVFILQ